MSEENVANLRAFLEQLEREPWIRGTSGPEDVDLSICDPGVVYVDTVLPDHIGDAYHGRDGVRQAGERWFEPFDRLAIELERIVGEGDRLVSIHQWRSKARYTGIELESPVAWVWTFRDGKVIRMKSFRDPEEALEAAGLSE